MRKLRLNHERIEAEPLVQHGARHGAEAVAGDLVLRETHRAQRCIDRVLAHRTVVMPFTAKDHRGAAGQLVQVAQHGHGLLGQRHQVRRTVELRAP